MENTEEENVGEFFEEDRIEIHDFSPLLRLHRTGALTYFYNKFDFKLIAELFLSNTELKLDDSASMRHADEAHHHPECYI